MRAFANLWRPQARAASYQHLVEPVVYHCIRERQVGELTMAVSAFFRRENALCHRSTHAPTKALEQVHGDGTLSLSHQSTARTADIPKGVSDAEIGEALQPCRDVAHSKATERSLEAELHARRHLLIGDAVNLLQPQRRWVSGHLRSDKTDHVGAQVRNRRVRHQCLAQSCGARVR